MLCRGRMNRKFAFWLVAAMLGGIAFGLACHAWLAAAQIKPVTDGLGLVTTVFLRLIKMIIAPLVFSTLVAGIAHMEGAAAVGRIGAKSIAWFLFASLVSLTLGLVMVHLFQPGAGLALPSERPKASPPACRLRISSPIWCRAPSSRRWPITRSCRS